MAKFNVVIKASAEKELEKLPNVAVAEILTVIYSLAVLLKIHIKTALKN